MRHSSQSGVSASICCCPAASARPCDRGHQPWRSLLAVVTDRRCTGDRRERAAGYYSTEPFAGALFLIELPYLLVQSIFYCEPPLLLPSWALACCSAGCEPSPADPCSDVCSDHHLLLHLLLH